MGTPFLLLAASPSISTMLGLDGSIVRITRGGQPLKAGTHDGALLEQAEKVGSAHRRDVAHGCITRYRLGACGHAPNQRALAESLALVNLAERVAVLVRGGAPLAGDGE